ncbi:hypothetical protein JKP88DRAFT_246069 [Tribonema minus]|uniref:Uncharacterized protein n=1 Tax=Tribonema minus TaxID=303371 RepID=A0A835YYD0_9STRA|nr:hypothetical protein JKP88DRAFT_246069 [Tribonema minus]
MIKTVTGSTHPWSELPQGNDASLVRHLEAQRVLVVLLAHGKRSAYHHALAQVSQLNGHAKRDGGKRRTKACLMLYRLPRERWTESPFLRWRCRRPAVRAGRGLRERSWLWHVIGIGYDTTRSPSGAMAVPTRAMTAIIMMAAVMMATTPTTTRSQPTVTSQTRGIASGRVLSATSVDMQPNFTQQLLQQAYTNCDGGKHSYAAHTVRLMEERLLETFACTDINPFNHSVRFDARHHSVSSLLRAAEAGVKHCTHELIFSEAQASLRPAVSCIPTSDLLCSTVHNDA